MTIINRIACMTTGHRYGEYRKIMRQWRKRATCNRCGHVSIKRLTPEERETYEQREARTIRRQAKEQQRQADRSAARSQYSGKNTRQIVREINAAADSSGTEGTAPETA